MNFKSWNNISYHQNLITLALTFVIQLIIGSVCIVFSYREDTDFNNIFQNGYNSLQIQAKDEIQKKFQCCADPVRGSKESELYCTNSAPCIEVLNSSLRRGLKISGGLGVGFSVLQVSGFKNKKLFYSI